MKTHFDPILSYDDAERAMCGTWIGDSSGMTGMWSHVDCKKCLRKRKKIDAAHEAEERAIVAQMGEMAAFIAAHMQQEQPQ